MAGLNDTSSRDLPEPIAAPAPAGPVTRPAKPLPVWLRLRREDGTERTLKGFAFAWAGDVVLVQYLAAGSYHLTARELWTEAANVTLLAWCAVAPGTSESRTPGYRAGWGRLG